MGWWAYCQGDDTADAAGGADDECHWEILGVVGS